MTTITAAAGTRPRQRSARWRTIRARLAPYYLILPGWLWLAIFFVVPTLAMLSVSTMSGNIEDGFKQTFAFSTYRHAWDSFHTQIIRSLIYGLTATAICLVIAYPVAYWIAFRGGRH
jgi:spermidine/putrescine transport system permease protein